ncbi:MAG: cation transporter [Proteobacteria bacterium]|nr:cation transporter [Pseudomonadota bacterium]
MTDAHQSPHHSHGHETHDEGVHPHGHEHAAHSAHDHHHHDHAASRHLPLALVLTLGFAVIEALAGWWSGSLALLGDAGHMVTDALSLGLAALANSLFMLVVVALLSWQAVLRLMAPREIVGEAVTLVALGGLVLNLVVAWLLTRGEGDLNTRGALLHVMGDLLGSVAALAAGLVIQFTGWTPIDPLLTMLICGLILASTLSLLRSVVHTLLEGVPDGISLPDVGRAMAAVEGVRSVHDLHIWSLDSRRPALSAHLVLTDARRWPAVLAAQRAMLAERFGIEHVTLQPELPAAAPLVFMPGGSRHDHDHR